MMITGTVQSFMEKPVKAECKSSDIAIPVVTIIMLKTTIWRKERVKWSSLNEGRKRRVRQRECDLKHAH